MSLAGVVDQSISLCHSCAMGHDWDYVQPLNSHLYTNNYNLQLLKPKTIFGSLRLF